MQLVILLFVWAVSLFITYQLIASGVRAGVSALAVDQREGNDLLRAQNQLLERIARHMGVPQLAKPAARAQAAIATSTANADDPEAMALLKRAQDDHFSKRFAQAVDLYRQIVDRFPNTKQAIAAQAQIDNLRGVA